MRWTVLYFCISEMQIQKAGPGDEKYGQMNTHTWPVLHALILCVKPGI